MNENPEKIYKCKYCGQEFLNHYKYASHISNHKNNKICYCEICGKQFTKSYSLTYHIRKHHFKQYSKMSSGGCFQQVKCDKCGNYFQKANFNKHYKKCDGTYIKGYIPNKKTGKYFKDGLFICECGKDFKNGISLGAHFISCQIHRSINGLKPRKSTKGIKLKDIIPIEKIIEMHKKSRKTLKDRIKAGIITYKGKKHTQEEKDKIRLGTIKYLKKNPNFHGPRYNKKACEYIDELNKKNNWNLIHALNGKEECIFGYFVDGYDKNLNIVFEYDEPKHYEDVYNNILKEKDLFRQKQIIDKTNCTFYRYNEKLDLLYKVN